jgi:hypothetical protein
VSQRDAKRAAPRSKQTITTRAGRNKFFKLAQKKNTQKKVKLIKKVLPVLEPA